MSRFEHVVSLIGEELAKRLRDLTLAIYTRAAQYAETKGMIIADTKFEFGFVDDELVLGDEVLTPDSSRFWPAETYKPGGRSFPSTSSSCATTSNRFAGTSSRLRRRCRTRSPRRRARNIGRPTSILTGRDVMNWLDIVLLLILVASVATSFRKGFSREIIGLVR